MKHVVYDCFMARCYAKKSLADAAALALQSDLLDDAYPASVWAEEARAEYESESAAENAWLRAAENAGWEEALVESYYDSGLLARPW